LEVEVDAAALVEVEVVEADVVAAEMVASAGTFEMVKEGSAWPLTPVAVTLERVLATTMIEPVLLLPLPDSIRFCAGQAGSDKVALNDESAAVMAEASHCGRAVVSPEVEEETEMFAYWFCRLTKS